MQLCKLTPADSEMSMIAHLLGEKTGDKWFGQFHLITDEIGQG